MGKKGASSWLTAVKRAFRSPSKDEACQVKILSLARSQRQQLFYFSNNRLDTNTVSSVFQQKREKRRWLFRKSSTTLDQQTPPPSTPPLTKPATPTATPSAVTDEQRHAIALAVASAATAEAAVATAQAAAEVVRLTRPSTTAFVREHYAAIVIQTAFRGYLVGSLYIIISFSFFS